MTKDRASEINKRLDQVYEAIVKQDEQIKEQKRILEALYKELYRKEKRISDMANKARQENEKCRKQD